MMAEAPSALRQLRIAQQNSIAANTGISRLGNMLQH
jgi:hypothetical protein